MKAIVYPGTGLKGSVIAPASKSEMQRACAAALLRRGNTRIHNYGVSDDDKAALGILTALGTTVQYINHHTLEIQSKGLPEIVSADLQLDCGESGLSLRMFTPIVSLCKGKVVMNGRGTLLQRPLKMLEEVLPLLDVQLQSNQGKLPLGLTGPLRAKDIHIDGSMSSQLLTGLLFAYAAGPANAPRVITVDRLASKPYIDLTLNIIRHFGLQVPVNENYERFVFPAAAALLSDNSRTLEYTVSGDWSGAAFLMTAAALGGDITLTGLDLDSPQGDKRILEALMQYGCNCSIAPGEITISANRRQPVFFDATDCPDLFPPLVALSAFAEGTSVIRGVHRLKHKESDRAATLQSEFGKMGLAVRVQDDDMIVEGKPQLQGCEVHSCNDHRIAMACTVAAMRASGPVSIRHAEAVSKSYPRFYQDMGSLGMQVEH
jgi:3-phosphoshikimate 1-carboxyvinyltransferase